MTEPQHHQAQNKGFLSRTQKIAFYATILYAVLIFLLSQPTIQRHVAYQHYLSEPFRGRLDVPEKYGLAPGKTLDTKILTSDNVTLGAWFVLADPYYQSLRSGGHPTSQPSLETIQAAIQAYPTILYLHGAAGRRSTTWRVQGYNAYTSRMQANVLVIDYRGFGDSEGSPSEAGLALDAYAAWTWLIEQGARSHDVLIYGHSLGTGVAGKLGSRLARENVKPRGIVLTAPFSSLSSVVETYNIFGFPVLQPLQQFAWGRKLIKRLTIEEYNTLSVIREFNVPTLIAHAVNDFDVPHTHSRTLLDHLLDPLLPPAVDLPSAPGTPMSEEEYAAFIEVQGKRREARATLVRKVEVPNFGVVEEFDGTYGKVIYVETMWGSHALVGLQEGVQDAIISTFRLGGRL
ncbi:hypothetical protein IEO21_04302 [Rhodonia placenta]|uniref:AB hydrolase-1 domain-containing protein n=1 Tax=Rhodonia placenta TaxID=104341 RepID=A0A8H7P438_9APHY|nr:hypothetical protein IEO21_04302 [Postia placenta]